MTWIRWDCRTPHHETVHALAEELRVRTAEAHGLYAAVCCGFGEYQTDGRVAAVTDTSLEKWATWEGRRGRFAGAFRTHCVETREGQKDAPGVVKGWWRQAALLRKQAVDAARPGPSRRDASGSDAAPDDPAENPPETRAGSWGVRRGDSAGDVDVDVNDNGTTPVSRSAREVALLAQLQRDPDRWAVIEFLERVPETVRAGWVGRLSLWLRGEEFPPGACPTASELATALRDYTGSYAPVHVRAFVTRLVKQRGRQASGPSRASGAAARLEANRAAAAAFVKGAPDAQRE